VYNRFSACSWICFPESFCTCIRLDVCAFDFYPGKDLFFAESKVHIDIDSLSSFILFLGKVNYHCKLQLAFMTNISLTIC
jgi:hypothetical protein